MTPAQAKTELLARRKELLTTIAGIEEQLDEVVAQDDEDAANERQEDEVLSALGQADQAEITRIDAALQRIADGTYGVCAECGEDIASARLKALPDAALCVTCAAS